MIFLTSVGCTGATLPVATLPAERIFYNSTQFGEKMDFLIEYCLIVIIDGLLLYSLSLCTQILRLLVSSTDRRMLEFMCFIISEQIHVFNLMAIIPLYSVPCFNIWLGSVCGC